MSPISIFRVFGLFLALGLSLGCARTADVSTKVGNGEGFGGGDPFGSRLVALRNEMLLLAAQDIAAGVDSENLCDLSRCPAEEAVCQELTPISSVQAADCQSLMVKVAPLLVRSLGDDSITVSGSSERLYHEDNEVAALTPLTSGASIRVSYPRVTEMDLNDAQLAALLGHEFLHTVVLPEAGGYLHDDMQYRSFEGPDGGSRLLDVLGVMFVSHFLRNREQPGLLTASLPTVDFGHVRVGKSKKLTLILENRSGTGVNGITLGEVAAPYALIPGESNCGKALAPSASCALVFSFSPDLPGRASQSIDVDYSDPRRDRALEVFFDGRGAQEMLLGGKANLAERRDPFTGAVVAAAFPMVDSGIVSTASGDVNGDGYVDVIVGAGAGARPKVSVFSGKDDSLLYQIEAYNPGFLGGVDVACADLNGDGYADVITGPGPGGGPHVKAFDGRSQLKNKVAEFFAFDASYTTGIRVAGGDMDGDGQGEIVVGSRWGKQATIQIFSLQGESYVPRPTRMAGQTAPRLTQVVYSPESTEVGVELALGDTTGDGRMNLITGAANHGPHLLIFALEGESLIQQHQFYAHPHTEGLGMSSLATLDSDGDGVVEILAQSGLTHDVTIWNPLVSFTVASGGFAHDARLDLSIGLR